MSRIIDLTLPVKPGSTGVALDSISTVERDGWNSATWHLFSHSGTHMDAPVHFGVSPETIDQLPLAECMGPAWVVRLPETQARVLLKVKDLGVVAEKFQLGESLLLQTGWSRHADDLALYRDSLPRISEELAHWCVQHRVRILGVEPPSVADVNNLEEVTRIHHILLGGGVTSVEGLAGLDQITQDRVFFVALPMKLAAGDGSPVRAMALEGLPPSGWI